MQKLSLWKLSPTLAFGQGVLLTPKDRTERRKKQSITANELAQKLLALLDAPTVELGRGTNGEPLWPSGFVGSLTHCPLGEKLFYVSSLVSLCQKKPVHFVGIDAEPLHPLVRMQKLSKRIFSQQEMLLLEQTGVEAIFTAAFSGKETIYKALYPLFRRYFSFDKACLLSIEKDLLLYHLDKELADICQIPREFPVFWNVSSTQQLARTATYDHLGPCPNLHSELLQSAFQKEALDSLVKEFLTEQNQ